MREDPILQVAEHSFGYSVKAQVVTDNPAWAIILGLRSLGWLTYKQCELRVFGWSLENAIANSPVHKRTTLEAILELAELGLVTYECIGTIFHPDGTQEPFGIKTVREANSRLTRRYDLRVNKGDCDEKV